MINKKKQMKVIKIGALLLLVVSILSSCQGPFTEKENGQVFELS